VEDDVVPLGSPPRAGLTALGGTRPAPIGSPPSAGSRKDSNPLPGRAPAVATFRIGVRCGGADRTERPPSQTGTNRVSGRTPPRAPSEVPATRGARGAGWRETGWYALSRPSSSGHQISWRDRDSDQRRRLRVPFASLYWRSTAAGIRPRPGTSIPFAIAHVRIVLGSRPAARDRADARLRRRLPRPSTATGRATCQSRSRVRERVARLRLERSISAGLRSSRSGPSQPPATHRGPGICSQIRRSVGACYRRWSSCTGLPSWSLMMAVSTRPDPAGSP
jgi:hypothetical protein